VEFYKSLQGALVGQCSVPFLAIAETYPAPEAWEKVFPNLIQEQRAAHVAELLPILNGDMEKTPLQVFNAYRQAFREEVSWSAQKGETGAVTEEEKEHISKIHYDALEPETRDPEHEELLDLGKRVAEAKRILSMRISDLEKKSPRTTRPKIRKIAELYLETKSISEVAKESMTAKKTASKIVLELGLAPLKLVKPRKKAK